MSPACNVRINTRMSFHEPRMMAKTSKSKVRVWQLYEHGTTKPHCLTHPLPPELNQSEEGSRSHHGDRGQTPSESRTLCRLVDSRHLSIHARPAHKQVKLMQSLGGHSLAPSKHFDTDEPHTYRLKTGNPGGTSDEARTLENHASHDAAGQEQGADAREH